MKRNALISFLIAVVMSISLMGCSTAEDATDADATEQASLEEVTGDDLNNAYYLLATAIPEDSTMQSLYVVGDEDNKVIRGTFTSMADGSDKAALTSETEQLLKSYSDMALTAAKNRAEEAGDDEAAARWTELIEEESSADDAGMLFDDYKAIITIKNSDGTVTIEGDREAGADSSFNWQ